MLHHISIRTADIHRAIAFYQLLGFEVSDRFSTGYTLACWLEGQQGRLELIQIPQPAPPPDAFGDEHYVGYYHLSFDLGGMGQTLPQWLSQFEQALKEIGYPLNILLAPEQQMIGDRLYEVAFIADLDGLPLELIRPLTRLPKT